jgi:[glutamine synthetase] adenylyltransferase / [glutamine synthetase]-adenylyl-L-tyrosine phosphorylase
MARALAGSAGDDEAAFKARLRRLRQRVLLRVMARDLSGRAGLPEVCAAMSDLAELEISSALSWTEPRADIPANHLVVVGMGKLGGRELNVSSDVDLIFIHPGGIEDDERYQRAGRMLIRLLSENTQDGFAFRVDMRLRPYGESGPLACNLDFLESYLVSQGREWERYAWIKARCLTGSKDFQARVQEIVRPFVFRKYLDYGTLAAMRRLHAEVRRDVERRDLAEHVKLGPGGIREIEFIVQALQLVRGGRDPELALAPTLDALAVFSRKGILPPLAAQELAEAYVFLRKVEHRLQYLDDAQRHDLPADEADRARIAAMSGFASWPEFSAKLSGVRAAVARHFHGVLGEPQAQPAGEAWPDHPRLAALRASQRYAALPAESKLRLDALVPALAAVSKSASVASGADPEATLVRGIDLVEAIASRAAYLALLAENPHALERVARIVGASSWAAQFLTLHPLLLDELLDDRVLYAPPDLDFFSRTLRSQLDAAKDDTERRMNLVREMHQAQVFRLLAQDLAGLLTVERLADHLSALADLALEMIIDEAWKDLPRKHRTERPLFSIVAYGKLGGKELGYASDLDIIFLYDDPHEQASEVYSRLAQRIISWLSLRTSSGVLFETDLALRPSGASGLLVSSIEAFERYQEKDAWVWEHQALTRARHSAGDQGTGARFELIREKILRRNRDPSKLKTEILAMREKLHAAHPNRSGLFDLKHDRGGMIDVEFAVQHLVLGHAHEFAALTGNLGNIALLGMAAEVGLIGKEIAENARNSYREYRRLQHGLRLNGAQYARVPKEQVAAHMEAVLALWSAVFP